MNADQRTRMAIRTGGCGWAALVLCLALAAPEAAIAGDPDLVRASAVSTRPGERVLLRFRGLSRRCGGVSVVAAVPGISPYPAQRLRGGRFARNGRFAVTWRVPARIRDGLEWYAIATQRCRGRRPRATITVDVAPPDLEETGRRQTRPIVKAPYELSDDGARTLLEDERYRGKLYDDDGNGGNCTVGYGHKVHNGRCNGRASEKPFEKGLTEEQARKLFTEDTAVAADAVSDLVAVPLSQAQADALIDLAFNAGRGAFARSELREKLNTGDYASTGPELKEWTRGNGRVLDALVRRRAAAAALFGTEPPDPTLEGRWSIDGGGLVEFVATGENTFASRWIVKRPGALCPEINDRDGDISLSGSGLDYSGTWAWVERDEDGNCVPSGDGSAVVRLREDGVRAQLTTDGPNGGHEEHTLIREGVREPAPG
jgi:lysozyme